jgi:conserved oligomeric Golgi complex subunit 6
LKDLSGFFTENTLESRRNLRSQIEKRSLEINKDFLASFRVVKDSLDEICNEVEAMNESVNKMRQTLHRTQTQTHELINQTNELQTERNKLSIHHDVATKLLSHFQLSPADHQILYGKTRDEKIASDFFRVLDQVQSIHNDCRLLMQNGFETIASDIMEEMTMLQEAGLERLYRWTQSHCRNIDTTTELTVLVIEAMQRLQDRPVLFKYVVDEYATNRRSVLVKQFIEALTIGGNGSKPIEMHITDPKRYIGDIFAWLHQAIHGERESLMILCRACDKNDITDVISSAMVSITDGVCHTLRVRVDTVLNSVNDTIVLYSIANLIRFYYNIITAMVKEGQLEQCLKEVQTLSETFYLNSLSSQVREILGKHNELQQGDLAPPPSVRKLLTMLKELLSVANMVEGRAQDIAKIVSCVVDPLLQNITEQASHLPAIDMAVYFLNVLYDIIGTLGVYEFIDERMERLNATCDAQIETLTSEQASSIVAHLNLGPIYTVLQSQDSKLDVHHLKICMVSMGWEIEGIQ